MNTFVVARIFVSRGIAAKRKEKDVRLRLLKNIVHLGNAYSWHTKKVQKASHTPSWEAASFARLSSLVHYILKIIGQYIRDQVMEDKALVHFTVI